ncbi:MAG: DedA family protein, partial [Mycobacteriales bacterium]
TWTGCSMPPSSAGDVRVAGSRIDAWSRMTHFLTTHVAGHGYLAVFVLMVLESMFIPIPSEVIMLFGGALAGGLLAEPGQAHVTLVGVGLLGAAGNVVGSLIGYAIGRYGGGALVEHRWVSWLIRPHHVERADAFFVRHGSAAVFVGRLLPVVRTFISLPAGLARMPVGRFTVFTALGCLPWTFALAAIGDAVAQNWDSVARGFSIFSIVLAVFLVIALVVWWRRNAGTDDPATETGARR